MPDPFLKPRIRVVKRPLPFRVLEGFRVKALRDFNRLMVQVTDLIDQDLEVSQPSVLEPVLVGSGVEDPALKAVDRRSQYGLRVEDLPGISKSDIQHAKPFLKVLSQEVLRPKVLLTNVQVVPMTKIVIKGTYTEEKWEEVCASDGMEEVVLLKDMKEDVYVILEGLEWVLKRRLQYWPVVKAQVIQGEGPIIIHDDIGGVDEVARKQENKKLRRKLVESELMLTPLLDRLVRKAYISLSALEPLARNARKLSRDDFRRVLKGEMTEEESLIDFNVLVKEADKHQCWLDFFNRARLVGNGVIEASRSAESEPEYLRRKSLSDAVLLQMKLVKEKWDKEREEMATMNSISQALLSEDGIKWDGNLDAFWLEANKAKRKKYPGR